MARLSLFAQIGDTCVGLKFDTPPKAVPHGTLPFTLPNGTVLDQCRLPPLGGPVLGGADRFGTVPSAFTLALRTVLEPFFGLV